MNRLFEKGFFDFQKNKKALEKYTTARNYLELFDIKA
jgi:hypothetical protein